MKKKFAVVVALGALGGIVYKFVKGAEVTVTEKKVKAKKA